MMDDQIIELAKQQTLIEPAANLAFIAVETGGIGFSPKTGKLIIQFEPSWFRKKEPFAPSGKWSVNGVERQTGEWLAFNNAFSIDKISAMESTSIGLGQIMGFHYERLGYQEVGQMWDNAKIGLVQQFSQMLKFIETDPKLLAYIRAKNWYGVASRYNGANFMELAKRIGRTPYNISMANEYKRFSKLLK